MKKSITLIITAIIIIAIGGSFALLIDHSVSILFLPLSFGLAMFVLLSAIAVVPRRRVPSKPILQSILDLKVGDENTVGYVFVHRAAAAVGMGIVFLMVHLYYAAHSPQYSGTSVTDSYGWTTIIPIELTMTMILLIVAVGTKGLEALKKKWQFVGVRTIIK